MIIDVFIASTGRTDYDDMLTQADILEAEMRLLDAGYEWDPSDSSDDIAIQPHNPMRDGYDVGVMIRRGNQVIPPPHNQTGARGVWRLRSHGGCQEPGNTGN